MRVSILIPAFNAADFIEETLESCLNQGQQLIEEIIIIDDYSTDETSAVVRTVQKRSQSIPILLALNPKKGACSASNFGLSIARGEAIQWLDADDLLGDGKLKSQLSLLADFPDHLIASKWQRFSGSLENLWPEEKGNWTKVPLYSSPREWLLSERMMIPAGWLGTRKLFQEIQPWDESLLINQDGEYFTRAVTASAGVLFEPESRVYYRSSIPGSVSHFSPEKAPSLFRSAESFENTILTLGDDKAMKTLISNYYQEFIYRVYPHVPELRQLALQKIKFYGNPDVHLVERTLWKLIYFTLGWENLMKSRLFLRSMKSRYLPTRDRTNYRF